MCGITAVLTSGDCVDRARFEAATLALRHRGGDGESVEFLDADAQVANVALGHCRLSIFDLTQAGRQPMKGAGSRWIVFNGSIFNWYEIRSELESLGYSFETRTDTEVILAAFDRWGERCVERFNGFWAFVIAEFEPVTGRAGFFLSRDRFGIKPLYYAKRGQTWCFASELSAIWRYFEERPSLDLRQAHRFMVYDRSHDSDATLYQGMRELLPGSNGFLRFPYEDVSTRRYWSLEEVPTLVGQSDERVLDRFSELIEDAARLRLRADREVALTLSGGVDSSVSAVASARVSPRQVAAFTSRFPTFGEIDETRYAVEVARKLGIEPRLVNCEAFDLRAEERRLTRHQELMYTSFSMLVNWNVLRAIRETGTRILITGQGGDELLLGYERYYSPFARNEFARGLRHGLSALAASARNSKLSWATSIAYATYFAGTRLRKWRYLMDARGLFADEFICSFDDSPASVSADLRELQIDEIMGSQLRRLLRYDDRTAGAFGLEARPVFLDHRLVEFCFSLSWEFKIRHGWTKYIARKYLERHGLHEIAWRRNKLGYAAPTLDWTNQLLPEFADCVGIRSVHQLLKPGLSIGRLAPRLRFRALNLLSTAKVLGWA